VLNKVYVANYSADAIEILDGRTNQVTTIANQAFPTAVAVNPVSGMAYIANFNDENVEVVNGATGTASTISLAPEGWPNDVGVNPVTNTIYVPDSFSNVISLLDGATNTVIGNLPTGSYPWRVAVNPVTNTVYVANQRSANVTVIDGATLATTTVPTLGYPIAITADTRSNKIYVACDAGGSSGVTIIDGATNVPTNVLGGGTAAVVADPITGKIYLIGLGSVSNALSTIEESAYASIPLATSITPLPNNQAKSATPTFTFTVASRFSPYAPTPEAVYYQVDTLEGPWTAAKGANPTFSGKTGALTAGSHVVYAYAVDGQEAGMNGSGSSGQILTGAITAYAFTVVP